jgi:hypothetical protein
VPEASFTPRSNRHNVLNLHEGAKMSLEQASFLAQIISALAIIASLIFVGVQLRQATRAMRNSSSQAHSAIYSGVISTIIDNGEFASIWRRGLADPGNLNEDEWVRFIGCASAQFRFFESSRVQWLQGLLDEEHWQNIEAQVNSFASQPGIQAWWELRRDWHSVPFRRWFEALPGAHPNGMYQRIKEGSERDG